ncbi:MAG TPA: class E sortase [Acidimicrobiales bacterium]|jgi:LPXTG-site transpeptidase (sortase) family protein|nr:class E sortase [Acidimicrobiales bacterium]
MTATMLLSLVALVVIALVGWSQLRVLRGWQRRSRRGAALERLMSGGLDVGGVAGAAEGSPASARVVAHNPLDRLALWVRHNRAAKRGMTALVGLLVLIAIGIIAYPLLTDLYTNRLQQHLRNELNSAQLQQDYRNHAVKVGDALTRIKIPTIGVDVVVVEGTTTSALRAGAGHYVQTPLPCLTGNVGIAGHRTTYGKPFHDLQKLHQGDTIVLETPIGQCTYHVNKAPFSVRPSDTSVLNTDPAHPSTLTLTTCDPPGSAARRLIVQATLDPKLNKQRVS